jgi:hypothetical protein
MLVPIEQGSIGWVKFVDKTEADIDPARLCSANRLRRYKCKSCSQTKHCAQRLEEKCCSNLIQRMTADRVSALPRKRRHERPFGNIPSMTLAWRSPGCDSPPGAARLERWGWLNAPKTPVNIHV